MKDENIGVTKPNGGDVAALPPRAAAAVSAAEIDNHSRLDDLAEEAAKKVDEFNALLADVESRSRNQRFLLARHYDSMDSILKVFATKRPSTLDLSNDTKHSSGCHLRIDEVEDFGPLSQKLKSKQSSFLSPPVPSGRRFSAVAFSLPRSPYGRKGSLPPVSASNTRLPPHSSSTLPHPASKGLVLVAPFQSEATKAVTVEHNSVGGLVKLFSEVAAGGHNVSPAPVKRAPPTPLQIPPTHQDSLSASARLLVRGPEKTVFASEPMSPLADRPSSPRFANTLTLPQQAGSTNGLHVDEGRSVSPSFLNSFFFGKEKPKKSASGDFSVLLRNGVSRNGGKVHHQSERNLVEKSSSEAKADGSSLERLLASLNFSKFRLTDRQRAAQQMGSGSSSSSDHGATMPRTVSPYRRQHTAKASSNGAEHRKVGQQQLSPGQKSLASNAGSLLEVPPTPAPRSSITRTTSQPSGLSKVTEDPVEDQNEQLKLVARTDRPRVSVSEDRQTGPALSLSTLAADFDCGAIDKVSEDIAALITDIRQHYQSYRKRDLSTSTAPSSSSLNSSAEIEDSSSVNNGTRTELTKVSAHEPEILTEGAMLNQAKNRDCDYNLASVVSDDYAESCEAPDIENFEVDTESTSSSFIFSPSVASRAPPTSVQNYAVQQEPSSSNKQRERSSPSRDKRRGFDEAAFEKLKEEGHTSTGLEDDSDNSVAAQLPTSSSNTSFHRKAHDDRTMTFPPPTRKSSTTVLPGIVQGREFVVQSGTDHDHWHHTQADDPENRLSSASYPESAFSLTDSVYSTAGSTSLSSYIDTSMSDTSSVRPTLLSESSDQKDTRNGKPRYHSDPQRTAVTISQIPEDETNTTPVSFISEPILSSSIKVKQATPPPLSKRTHASKKNNLNVPSDIKCDLMRESGGNYIDVYPVINITDKPRSSGQGPVPPLSPAVSRKQYRNDSFGASDKRLPRGPFGIRLEEDQMKRERVQQRQLVQDLSFLHDSPASSPGLPELHHHHPTDHHLALSHMEGLQGPKRRQSSGAHHQHAHNDKSIRSTRQVSSPDLYRSTSHREPSNTLRVADISRSVSDAQASSWKKITEETDSAICLGSTESMPTESGSISLSTVSSSTTDFRTHIVRELYDTESSYVDSLQILEKYYETLKNNEEVVDKTLASNMFYQIPSIKAHHVTLLEGLKDRFEHWDNRQKIGDLIVDTFTKESVIDTYTAFIHNWKTAKDAIKLAKSTKPCFVKFLEDWTREHRGKLDLDALLIMPVQRIPRYELLIKELLKHTAEDHPDRPDLELAQNELHDLALKINAMESEVDEAERMIIRLKELELNIDGLNDLVEPNRKFLKFDLVTMSTGIGLKKDRCLFLFSDLLIITNLKRKSRTTPKPLSHSCSPQLYPTLDSNKYRLLMKVSLEDLELAKPALCSSKRSFSDREILERDLEKLNRISELSVSLSGFHQPLDDAVRSLVSGLSRQLSLPHSNYVSESPALTKVELSIATQNGVETITVSFLTASKRNAWERAFLEAKQALTLGHNRRQPPDFLTSIPIRKTRAGLQLTCAAATTDTNAHDLKDIWVGNSDGYVGQVCVLSMQPGPEPTLTSCVAVSNCKITCIASIPPAASPPKTDILHSGNASPILSDHSSSGTDLHGAERMAIDLDSDESSDEDASIDDHSRSLPSEKETFQMSFSEDEMGLKVGEHIPDSTQGTMWVGMENGRIFIHYCNDNIRIRKARVKIQLSSSVHSIIGTENSVFVGMGNGQIAVFGRPPHGFWETCHPDYIDLKTSQAAPVQRMLIVCGRLWCACLNMIYVINVTTLRIESTFPVVAEATRHVSCLVGSGLGVWISVQNSTVLRLCHALTCEFIGEINLTPSVQKMLAGCDEILRQHKFACLRITALLACKDLLWVGTSAGVIMTVNMPHVVQGMTKLTSMPTVTGIWHGHAGPVRFLQAVEQPATGPLVPQSSTRRSIRRDRRHSVSSGTTNKMMVVSGGDGYEDFRCTSHSNHVQTSMDNTGRDDSTNHLLMWHC